MRNLARLWVFTFVTTFIYSAYARDGEVQSQCLRGSEDSSQESVLSFHWQAQSRDLYLCLTVPDYLV